jgi:hypothetical protein
MLAERPALRERFLQADGYVGVDRRGVLRLSQYGGPVEIDDDDFGIGRTEIDEMSDVGHCGGTRACYAGMPRSCFGSA